MAAGEYHTVGLKSDGTVMAAGSNDQGRLDVGTWTPMVQVAGRGYHTVGLKSDGTVAAAGYNEYGQTNVGAWNLGPTIRVNPQVAAGMDTLIALGEASKLKVLEEMAQMGE